MTVLSRLVLFSILVPLSGCVVAGRDALFRLTIHVVDDEGRPVQSAIVRIGADRRPQPGESEGNSTFAEGVTDEKGLFSGELEAWDASQAGYRVEKQGHYGVWLAYHAKPPVGGKWQPWNPTIEAVLKRQKNPVPMYAKRVHGQVPAKGTDVGYDLVVGDWVAPYGIGKTTDFLFHGDGEWSDPRNYRGVLTVTVPGRGNGLVAFDVTEPNPSPLRMPYMAPEDGYQAQRQWRSIRRYNSRTMEDEENINDSSSNRNFFVRVRSELDSSGKVVRALYGKIHAPFEFGLRGKDGVPAVHFTYYLNPDGTRNIEFDPRRNLLKSIKRDDPDFENLAP